MAARRIPLLRPPAYVRQDGRTLLITHSWDATSDVLVEHLGAENVFRLNSDLYAETVIEIDESSLRIAYGDDAINFEDVAKVVWWKAFNGKISADAYIEAEVRYILREIYNLFEVSGKCVLTRPHSDQYHGKISQMKLARNFFAVPQWCVTLNDSSSRLSNRVVVKSLSSEQVTEGKVLFTREVDPAALASQYPWFTQHLVDAEEDLTVVYLYGRTFGFTLDRRSFEGLDWREHCVTGPLPWQPADLPVWFVDKIRGFMGELQLNFGRLDFLRAGGVTHFLEVNSNGQWAWLDPGGEYGLLQAIVQAVHPRTPMPACG